MAGTPEGGEVQERLVLVTDFAQLRAGMIVVVECEECGMERTMLLGLSTCDDPDYPEELGRNGWEVAPSFPCDRDANSLITAGTVAYGIVYRVLDGLEQSQATTKKRSG